MILLTGGSGFIGGNLKKTFDNIMAPTHKELDLTDIHQVMGFIEIYKPTNIIHCASSYDFGKDIKMFYNLYSQNIPMIYFGSGAEGRLDDYGMSREIMNSLASNSRHTTNLKLYGCFGDGEQEDRFISRCIFYKHAGLILDIHKDKHFSYVYIKDLCKIVKIVLDKGSIFPSYEISCDEMPLLSEIAEMVGVKYRVIGTGEDYGYISYSFKRDYGFKFTPLKEAIEDYEASWTADVQAD